MYLAASPPKRGSRYDVRLANRRVPGVSFLLGFGAYLFLAQNGPDVPVSGPKWTRWACFWRNPFE